MASMNGSSLNGPHLTTVSGESLIGLGLASNSGSTKETDIVKVSFATREGVYRVMNGSDYRPNRIGYATTPQANTPVKVSFISTTDSLGQVVDRICFNIGRELFVFNYKGVKKVSSSVTGKYLICDPFHIFSKCHQVIKQSPWIKGYTKEHFQLAMTFRLQVQKSTVSYCWSVFLLVKCNSSIQSRRNLVNCTMKNGSLIKAK